jgi:hypothetical protein
MPENRKVNKQENNDLVIFLGGGAQAQWGSLITSNIVFNYEAIKKTPMAHITHKITL